MSRCKSAPSLVNTDSKNEKSSKIRRHGTLPITLLKRTDVTFFNSPESDGKEKPKIISNKKTEQQLKDQNKQLNQFISNTPSLEDSVYSNVAINFAVNDPSLIQNMLVELENLNKKVRLLESENCSLFYKLNNKNIRLVNNRDYFKIENETNLTAQIAKPETDSDEYKV